jgi:hypothetical protein
MTKIGRGKDEAVLYLSDAELQEIKETGYAMKTKFSNQQWAKIRKILKRMG